VFAFAVLLVLAGFFGGGKPAMAIERPNVLIVNLDDARFDALQYLPKTAGWMSSGLDFVNTRVAIPSCCPSRSSLFTGSYPHRNGVTRQDEGTRLDRQHTLARYLKSAGYSTGMAGKFLISWPRTSPPPDFDRHTVIWGGYYDYDARVEGVYRRMAEYSTVFLGRQIRRYLQEFEARDTTPWFAYIAPQAPHIAGGWKTLAVPENRYAALPVGTCAKPGEADRSDKPPYVGTVKPDPAYDQALCQSQIRTLRTVDDEIDLTMRQLQADGELSNTLVIVTSDNGYFWGEHGWKGKFLPYEPSVRVPLRLRWDGHVPAGTDGRLASVVDIMPTVLQATDITPAKTVDGRSLLRQDDLRDNLYSEYFQDAANGSSVPTWSSLANSSRKYIETYVVNAATGTTTTHKEYYDLRRDPGELVNLLGDRDPATGPPASELTWLTQRLAAARTCTGTGCP
jgi:N-acetylglucosamine-6-sulfatase